MIRPVVALFNFLILPLFLACDLGDVQKPDPQFLRVQLNHGFRDVVNTFDGTLTKDLVLDGTRTVPFWFTTAEQHLIISELQRAGFYELPDTIPQIPDVRISPNPGPQLLRVQADQGQKTVVWLLPPDQTNGNGEAIQQLASVIMAIVEAKPEFKQLPPARGAYL